MLMLRHKKVPEMVDPMKSNAFLGIKGVPSGNLNERGCLSNDFHHGTNV